LSATVKQENIRLASRTAQARPRPSGSTKALPHGLDEIRQRFISTFVAQCDAINVLVDEAAASCPGGPVAALTQITHRLSGLAGTIGFPTISARASDLEKLVGAAGRGALDGSRARKAVGAIRTALARDLARLPIAVPPPAVSSPSGSEIIVADEPDRPARVTPPLESAGHIPTIRVLIVDDHAIVRRGLRVLLAEEFRGAAFGEAANAQQAVEELRQHTWDVVLLDITLPGKSGLDLLKELKTEWPRLPVLVLSGHKEDQFAVRVLRAGAGGYMTKEGAPEELATAIRKVLTGGRYVSPALAEKLALGVNKDVTRTPHDALSDREYDVMARIGSGKTVTEIAKDLSLSAKTISTYRTRVLEKLGVKNSAEIVQYALRNGLVT
jgi:DNA-binding NarL/FixJ family response regulator/HPt (histidine-containing phosphotransfer) domain-containing protein